jgi:hypothetical protein
VVGKYCHSSDRTNHLEKISLLLTNKITRAVAVKAEAMRLLRNKMIDLLAILIFCDRPERQEFGRHTNTPKTTIINKLDSPKGYIKSGNSFDKNSDTG